MLHVYLTNHYPKSSSFLLRELHLRFTYVGKNPGTATDWKGLLLQNWKEPGVRGVSKMGFHMSERRNSSSSQERPPTVLAFHDGNQRAELVAQAEMLARYPANIREQITELLRILAEKPGEAENGVR